MTDDRHRKHYEASLLKASALEEVSPEASTSGSGSAESLNCNGIMKTAAKMQKMMGVANIQNDKLSKCGQNMDTIRLIVKGRLKASAVSTIMVKRSSFKACFDDTTLPPSRPPPEFKDRITPHV